MVTVLTRPADTHRDNSVNGDSVLTRPEVKDRDQTTLNGDSVLTRPTVIDRDWTLNGDSFPNKSCSHRDWTL